MRRGIWVLLALALCAPTIAAASAPAGDTSKLVDGNTTFALNLYAALRQDTDSNLIFSPYSVSEALAMVYAGARGETAAQMAGVLGFTLPQSSLHSTFGALNADLVKRGNAQVTPRSEESARALQIANALWGEQSYPFSAAFTAQLEQAYGAGLRQVDFLHSPEAARIAINDWVAQQTNNRIRDIVPPPAISSDTRLVLANAIYFSCAWADQFSERATENGPFNLADGSTATVPFMVNHEHFSYARGDGFQVVELPYAAGGFTFTVILPDQGKFEAVEAGLTPGALDAALGQLADTDVVLYLPRFTFDYDVDLGKTLQALGMTDAFDANHADLTGMVEGTPPEPLYVSAVLHKAFIAVDENGTEAAAATVVIAAAGAAPPQGEPTEVRVDRPFIFAIRDSQTGTILFLGRVMNPAG